MARRQNTVWFARPAALDVAQVAGGFALVWRTWTRTDAGWEDDDEREGSTLYPTLAAAEAELAARRDAVQQRAIAAAFAGSTIAPFVQGLAA